MDVRDYIYQTVSNEKPKDTTLRCNDTLPPSAALPHLESSDEFLEAEDKFDLESFQVVRREFFAHMQEPAITFNKCKLSVNTACIQKFPEVSYVQVLINQDTKIMALMPCPEGARDSFAWCSIKKGRRIPKAITCKLFFAKVFSMMGWNPDYRYKLLGKLIHANDTFLLAFDLTATEIYQRQTNDAGKVRTSRTPVFPAEWKDQFGLPYNEHQQSLQVSVFDGYAVYSISSSREKVSATAVPEETSRNIPLPYGGEDE